MIINIYLYVSICFNENPENVTYNVDMLRRHVYNMLETSTLIRFPTILLNNMLLTSNNQTNRPIHDNSIEKILNFSVRGLPNYDGVSCYSNSSLQSIVHCSLVLEKFLLNPETNVLNDTLLHYISKSNININKLRLFAHPQYTSYPLRQHDPAEFITHLCEKSSNLNFLLQNTLLLTSICLSCNDSNVIQCTESVIHNLCLPKSCKRNF